MSSFEPKKDKQVRPLPQSSAGGKGKPPKPTAVGTGGSDDEDKDKVRRLVRQNIDRSVWQRPLTVVAPDWPIPALKFVELDSTAQPTASADDFLAALTHLHTKRCLVAHLTTSDGSRNRSALGISCPAADDEAAATGRYKSASKVFLQGLGWPGLSQANSVAELNLFQRLELGDFPRYVGCVTGTPVAPVGEASPLSKIAKLMGGREYGLLVLAAPIPAERLALERAVLEDAVEKKEQKSDFAFQQDRRLLKKIEASAESGLWQTCLYYFSDEDRFAKLEGAIKQVYSTAEAQTNLSCWCDAYLYRSLDRLALPLTRNNVEGASSLNSYRDLTCLTAAELALYVAL